MSKSYPCVAVQHERAPRASPSKPKYLTQFAAAAAAGGFPPYYFPFKSAFYPPFFSPSSSLSINANHHAHSSFPLGSLNNSSTSSGGGGSATAGNGSSSSSLSQNSSGGLGPLISPFTGELFSSGLGHPGGLIPSRRAAVLLCRPPSRLSSNNDDKDELLQPKSERINSPHTGPSVCNDSISLNKEDEVSSSGGEEATLMTSGSGNYHKFLENLHIGNLIHESIYESAAKLLFLSVKWARSVPSFLNVRHVYILFTIPI